MGNRPQWPERLVAKELVEEDIAARVVEGILEVDQEGDGVVGASFE